MNCGFGRTSSKLASCTESPGQFKPERFRIGKGLSIVKSIPVMDKCAKPEDGRQRQKRAGFSSRCGMNAERGKLSIRRGRRSEIANRSPTRFDCAGVCPYDNLTDGEMRPAGGDAGKGLLRWRAGDPAASRGHI